MADVKLLKYDGTEQQYRGVERVQLAKVDGGTAIFSEGEAVEGIEISPDFSAGDMPVLAPTGTLVKSAVIVKPEELIPGNIRRGVTVAGIQGDLVGDTEERTVELSMADGDQIILPTQDGKVISQVTVTKPETLVPENILEGVEIGGVTGTLGPPDPVETEVTLDFSEGDMEVVPDAGKLFSKVSIPVPENLIPENIAKDVEIAGITGTHEGGGGSVEIRPLEVTENGIYVATGSVYGYSPVVVNVEQGADTDEINTILDQINGEKIGEKMYTVTFIYGTSAFQTEVREGNSCPDPVAGGLMETPTKKSSKYESYTFSGWSLTDGGSADPEALSNIESNRTVYAAFNATLIYIDQGFCGNFASWKMDPDYVITINGSGDMYDYSSTDLPPWEEYKDQITKVIILPYIATVGKYAFENSTNLSKISLAEGIINIKASAFYGCENLDAVELPDTLTELGYSAFQNTAVKNVEIPSGVKVLNTTMFTKAILEKVSLQKKDGWRYGSILYSSNYTELTETEAANATYVASIMKNASGIQFWWNENV